MRDGEEDWSAVRSRQRRWVVWLAWPLLLGLLTGSALWNRADWNVVWHDEFDGSQIDSSHWTFDLGNGPPNLPGWGNSELEYYTSASNNVHVSGGNLHIIGRKESFRGFNYTSARLKTQGLFSKQDGRFELRARLPEGQGLWPAFWLMPQDPHYGPWAASGEIDVMENRGNDPTTVLGTIHFGAAWPNNAQSHGPAYVFPKGDSVTNYHVYTLEWAPGAFGWAVDGHVYQTQTNWWSSGGPYPAPFDRPFYLIMNLAIGGQFPGAPNGSTAFPAEMAIDYIRVYEQTAPLALAVWREGPATIRLEWPTNIICRLQQADVSEPARWIDVVNVSNPYLLSLTANGGSRFYRLISP